MSEQHTTNVEYREIPSLPGYRFGSDGSVWTLWEPGGPRRWRIGETWAPRVLQVSKASGRYMVLIRLAAKKYKLCQVHRLIAEAFHGPCPDGMECRHLDGDRMNNRADNLCWGTRVQNARDRDRHGTTARGERQGASKLTRAKVDELRRRRSSGESCGELAKAFNVSKTTISRIARFQSWAY